MPRSVNRRVQDPIKTLNSVVKDSELVVMEAGTMQAVQWFKVLAISGKLASKRTKSAGYKIEDISYLVYETIEDLLFKHFEGPEDEFVGLEWFEEADTVGMPLDFKLDLYKGLRSQAKKSESIIKFLLKKATGAKARVRPIETVVTFKKGRTTYKRAAEELERPQRQLRIQSQRRPTKYISPEIPEGVEQSLKFISPEGEEIAEDFRQQYRHGLPTETYYEPEGGLPELLDVSEEEVEQLQRRPPPVPAYPPSERWEDEDEPSETQMRQIEEDDEWVEEPPLSQLRQLERVAGRLVGARYGEEPECHPRMEKFTLVYVNFPDRRGRLTTMTQDKPFQQNGEWYVDVRGNYGVPVALSDCRLMDLEDL